MSDFSDDDFMIEDASSQCSSNASSSSSLKEDSFENSYYNTKSLPTNQIKITQFINLSKQQNDWGFKATKQLIKISLKQQNNEYKELYKYLLLFKNITKNYYEKSIINLLELFLTFSFVDLLEIYQITLTNLNNNNNNNQVNIKTN